MLTIERISRIEELGNIEAQWNKVLHMSSSNTLFLSHEWIYNWWKSFGKDKELLILLVRDGEEVIGIAPLMIEEYKIGKLTFNQIAFIQNAHCYHLDFIINRLFSEVIDLIFQYLKKEIKDWRRIYLNRIPISAKNTETIRSSCTKFFVYKEQHGGIAPYIPVKGTWDEYYVARKRKFRAELRRDWKRLSAKGKIEFKMYKKDSGNIDLAFEELLAIARTTWKEKEGSAISSTPELTQFYYSITQEAYKNDQLALVIMYINNKPNAFLLCVNYNNVLYELKMSYNPDISQYSVGYFVANNLVKYGFDSLKINKIDLLGGEFTQWKRRYTDVGQEFTTFFVYKKTFLNCIYIFIRSKLKKRDLFNKFSNYFQNVKN